MTGICNRREGGMLDKNSIINEKKRETNESSVYDVNLKNLVPTCPSASHPPPQFAAQFIVSLLPPSPPPVRMHFVEFFSLDRLELRRRYVCVCDTDVRESTDRRPWGWGRGTAHAEMQFERRCGGGSSAFKAEAHPSLPLLPP